MRPRRSTSGAPPNRKECGLCTGMESKRPSRDSPLLRRYCVLPNGQRAIKRTPTPRSRSTRTEDGAAIVGPAQTYIFVVKLDFFWNLQIIVLLRAKGKGTRKARI